MVTKVILRQNELRAIEHVIGDWISCEFELETKAQQERLQVAMSVYERIVEAIDYQEYKKTWAEIQRG